jgi:DNA-binding transcriptional MerR regulator
MSLLVHEVAKRAKVSNDTVRNADRRGLISSVRDVNGWRRFSPNVVDELKKLYGRGDESSGVRKYLHSEAGSVLGLRGVAKKQRVRPSE